MTERICGEFYAKRVTSEVGGEPDVLWIIWDHKTSFAHPLVILTDYEAKALARVLMGNNGGS